jgi:hypothetical protein
LGGGFIHSFIYPKGSPDNRSPSCRSRGPKGFHRRRSKKSFLYIRLYQELCRKGYLPRLVKNKGYGMAFGSTVSGIPARASLFVGCYCLYVARVCSPLVSHPALYRQHPNLTNRQCLFQSSVIVIRDRPYRPLASRGFSHFSYGGLHLFGAKRPTPSGLCIGWGAVSFLLVLLLLRASQLTTQQSRQNGGLVSYVRTVLK